MNGLTSLSQTFGKKHGENKDPTTFPTPTEFSYFSLNLQNSTVPVNERSKFRYENVTVGNDYNQVVNLIAGTLSEIDLVT